MPEVLEEHFKKGVQACVSAFVKDAHLQEKELPSSFRAAERAYVHQEAKSKGLLSKSRGKGGNRTVTIFKKGSLSYNKKDAKITLSPNSKKIILSQITQNPLTRQERQELAPTSERDRARVEICRSMGRLASGIPQIPPKCNHHSRPLPASDPVVMALRGPQAVVLLKCGPEPRSRLLYVSQLLLNDAAERGQKIKIACTLCNGMSPKEMSTIVALDRNEKVTSTVGFQDKLESQVAPMSVLTFCSNEILLRTLISNDSFLTCLTHIVIDGVDENDRFCDLLLLVLCEAMTRFKMLKLVLLSKSENPLAFKNYPQFVALPLKEPSFGFESLMRKGVEEDEHKNAENVNFQALCLYAKLFAPPGFPFADFLARISNPPTFQTTRSSIHFLKTIEALNNLEDITELGNHLLDLPVEPRLGKTILYAVALKCLDPVLTIVACVAYKGSIFTHEDGVERNKLSLSGNAQSDHMTLIRAFQCWQEANRGGQNFCTDNGLSLKALQSIFATRVSIIGHLRASGFVRAKGPGDIKDLNLFSDNWAVVKAALAAGLYPNVALKHPGDQDEQLCAHKYGPVKISQDSDVQDKNHDEWFIYDERQENEIRGVTVVTPLTIFLFAGHNRLPLDYILESGQGNNMSEEASDSENENPEEANNSILRLDEWISFKSDSLTIQSLVQLRLKWSVMFLKRLKYPGKPITQDDEKLVRTIVNLLSEEEVNLGLSIPEGIGQRPKHLVSC